MSTPKISDPVTVVPRVNGWLAIGLLIMILFNVVVVSVLLNEVFFKVETEWVSRLYDNPENNELFAVDRNSKTRPIKDDVDRFVRYIVDAYDFQSTGTIRLKNINKIMSLSEDELLAQLSEYKNTLLRRETDIKFVSHEVEKIEYHSYPDNKSIIVAHVHMKTVKVRNDSKADIVERVVKLALKNVNKKYYRDSENIGGKFYGLTLVSVSDPVLSI